MKEEFDQESRDALVKYRLQKAKEVLSEVYFQKDNGYYTTAINRLYYACFYAVLALLVKYGISANTHIGVKTMLSLHFVKPGKLSPEHGRSFSMIFERRHSNDYDDFIFTTKEEVEDLLPRGEKFVTAIEELTQKL